MSICDRYPYFGRDSRYNCIHNPLRDTYVGTRNKYGAMQLKTMKFVAHELGWDFDELDEVKNSLVGSFRGNTVSSSTRVYFLDWTSLSKVDPKEDEGDDVDDYKCQQNRL
jgi:hypothetical protein